jgi:hypothetical protein
MKFAGITVAALLVLAGLSTTLTTVRAQTIDASLPDPIRYTSVPEVPGPQQQVSLTIQGVGSFLGSATITWSQNGKIVSSGVGNSQFTLVSGQLGTKTVVHVTIKSPTQGSFTHDFVISPSLVNLIWEADTTVPPMYRGKALYSGGADVTVVAFPEVVSGGSFISSQGLVFQWTLNNETVPTQSGMGRSTFRFQGDQLKNQEDVEVDIFIGNSKVAHGELFIPASDPQVVLYDRDPLRGEVFDAALPSAIHLVGSELSVQAEPFYISRSSITNSTLQYSWTLNGSDTSGPDAQKGILTLRQTGDSSGGSATIGVTVQNTSTSQLVQAADTFLTVLFGADSSSSSLFGL